MLHTVGPIGIDLAEDSARVLQLGFNAGELRVFASARIDLASLGIEHDLEQPVPDALLNAITRRIHSGGFRGKRCIISVPDRMLATRSVRIPNMSASELNANVRLDGPALLGFEDQQIEAQIGWLKTGDVYQGEDHKCELLYFGAPVERLEHIAFAFEREGLEPVCIEPHFLGVTRATTRKLRRTSDTEVVQLVLDVCHEHTNVLITRGDNLVFSKIAPVGGRHLNEAAIKRLGLDETTVTELRRERSSAAQRDENRISRAVFDALRPTMADIAREASLCLRHYSVTFRGSRPAQCLLVGPEASEPGFARVVQDIVGVETTPGAPLDGICTDKIVGAGSYSPAWNAVAGSAMRELLKRTPARKRNQRRTTPSKKAPDKPTPTPTERAA